MRLLHRLTTIAAALLIAASVCTAQNYQMCLFGQPMSGIYYFDIRSTPAGTVFKRYAWNNNIGNMMLLDTNTYAPLTLPPGLTGDMASWPETTWNDGVAFAATMQSRGAWRPEPIATATWTRSVSSTTGVSEDFIQFWHRNSDGSLAQLPLMKSGCLGSPYTDNGAFDPNRERRVCHRLDSGSSGYELRTSPSAGTTLRRYDNGVVASTNTYAALHPPAVGTLDPWNEGIAFAATMQTRGAWLYAQPTTSAMWMQGNGRDYVRFSTTVNGAATEFSFDENSCSLVPTPTGL